MKKIALFTLLLFIFFSFGCGNLSPDLLKPFVPSSQKGYDNDATRLTDEAIEEMLDIVFKVDTKAPGTDINISGGTAFLIKEDNRAQYFITCFHVVDDNDGGLADVYIRDRLAEIIKVDEKNDLALLSLTGKNRLQGITDEIIEIAKFKLSLGDAAFTAGFPGIYDGEGYVDGKYLTDGIIVLVDTGRSYFITNTTVYFGNSGGPFFVLLNGKPYIAGVAQAVWMGANLSGAVHYEYITDLLDKFDKEGPDEFPEPELEPDDEWDPEPDPAPGDDDEEEDFNDE